MQRIRIALQRSLATKVILSTVLLSLGVVWLTGSALYSRLSDGIRNVSLNSSVAEARYSIFNAQYQLLLTQNRTVEERRKILAEVIATATSQGINESTREVLIVKTPTKTGTGKDSYEFITNQVQAKSIPAALREKIQSSDKLQYQYANLEYAIGTKVDALIIGEQITIPKGGRYEMYVAFSLENQAATISLIKNSLLATGAALIFLIALITWLVARQVLRPVRDAARIAARFTSGDFSERMHVQSKDEIATLGIAFNEMALSIESQISRLENLSRVQQRFVSDVSHELRTPLTTLRMASEVIYNQRETFDPIISRSSELLVAQLDRFERLLEDLLEVSRFDAEVAVLEPIDFDLVSLVKRCSSDLAANSQDVESEIKVVSDHPSISIRADIRRIERIMRNLISNALDHCDGTVVEITIIGSSTEVAVGVRDHGTGLNESDLIRVYDRFWRADKSRARVRGGTGLGLSIALEDARLHNGELDAWGRPGKGAHFVLTVPLKAGANISGRPIRVTPVDFQEEVFVQ